MNLIPHDTPEGLSGEQGWGYKLLAWQLIIQLTSLLVVITVLSFFSVTQAVLWFVGGLFYVVPHGYFGLLAFRYSGASQAGKIVSSFYRGSTGKLVLTATLFALAFSYMDVLQDSANAVALLLGFTATVLVNGLSVFWLRKLR